MLTIESSADDRVRIEGSQTELLALAMWLKIAAADRGLARMSRHPQSPIEIYCNDYFNVGSS